ncbi:MAG: very short patch repair endonuclease [Patescibacteria group bacterium]
MDVFTKAKRSEIMSKIHSKNTKAELLVFRELKKRKIYFQKHYKKCAGCPDVAIPSKKIAVFIDGDFWHGYQFNKRKDSLPIKYWLKKIENNILRDRRNRGLIKKQGWKVLKVWEHEIIKSKEKTLEKIVRFIKL